MTSLSDFYDMLEDFDWNFHQYDDHAVWQAGHEKLMRIYEIARESEKHNQLYQAYHDWVYSQPPYSGAKRPKPQLKQYE